MIKTFDDLIKAARRAGPKTVAVAAAQDRDVLMAVDNAYKYGIINPVLIGKRDDIEAIARDISVDLSGWQVIDTADKIEACRKAVELVATGRAALPMKGFVDTSVILKAILDKEIGLMTGRLLSHVGVLAVPGYDRLFVQSDAAMNISPSVEDKVHIINNAVEVAHALGNDMPKVAVICAVEKVNPKMPATVDAQQLVRMNEQGLIKGCIVGGPFALDNAVSVEAAMHKGINHPVAGRADVLITPDIESGNILNKAMEYFGRADKAGIIMGASAPIVLTSRASSDRSKLNSIALAVTVAGK
jgi:phosphate butyryltransferase